MGTRIEQLDKFAREEVARLRAKNLELLQGIGKMTAADTQSFRISVERIERNNLKIERELGIIQAISFLKKD